MIHNKSIADKMLVEYVTLGRKIKKGLYPSQEPKYLRVERKFRFRQFPCGCHLCKPHNMVKRLSIYPTYIEKQSKKLKRLNARYINRLMWLGVM